MSISIFSYRKFGIQRILNVGSGIENLFPEEFLYSNIEILDVPEFNIIPGMYVNEGGKAHPFYLQPADDVTKSDLRHSLTPMPSDPHRFCLPVKCLNLYRQLFKF